MAARKNKAMNLQTESGSKEEELCGIPGIGELAKALVDLATDESPPEEVSSAKNPHAVELGRLGGKKGGKARAKKLTKERRSEIANAAAKSRWSKKI